MKYWMAYFSRHYVFILVVSVLAVLVYIELYSITKNDHSSDFLRKKSSNAVFIDVLAGNQNVTRAPSQNTVTPSAVNRTVSNVIGEAKQVVTERTSRPPRDQNASAGTTVTICNKPYTAYWVDIDAPFLKRIKAYNEVISKLREEIKTKRAFKSFQTPSSSPTVIWGAHDDFLEQVSNFKEVRTVALTWSTRETYPSGSNTLIDGYYTWTASEPLCTWINTPGFTKARWDAVYNRTCTTDVHMGSQATVLEPVYFHGKPINPDHYWPNKGFSYPREFYEKPPPHVLYIQICEDAVISSVGDVFCGSVKLVPYSCSHDRSTALPVITEMAIYSEVFIMSGHWGTAHFHKNVELFPRVAPYVDFLVDNPRIMIHVSETGGLTARILNLIGLNRDRLVTGATKAKVAYLPQGTPCGFAQVQGSQLLSLMYRNYVKHVLRVSVNNTNSTDRGNFVMIHRSGNRRFFDVFDIERDMKGLAVEFGLNFFMYHDRQLPSFEETMLAFNGAVMVVAPHGAGLSNIMYCEPGTYVIEGVCNPPHVNMCFEWLAHILGHRYHGIPSEEGCEGHVKVNPQVLKFVVRAYLQQWEQSLKRS